MAHDNTKTHRSATFSADKSIFSSFLNYPMNYATVSQWVTTADCFILAVLLLKASDAECKWTPNTDWYALIKKVERRRGASHCRRPCPNSVCVGGGGDVPCYRLISVSLSPLPSLRRVSTPINQGLEERCELLKWVGGWAPAETELS